MNPLGVGVPPVPGMHYLASSARNGVCLGVHGMQMPFGRPWSPYCNDVSLPCVSMQISDKGDPMPLPDPEFGQPPPSFVFFGLSRGHRWRKDGCR